MKILNLYCGIGGNRKLWGDEHDITAVELNPEIARIYQDFFPNDTVIIADAHEYLLNNYKDFDFVWSSPPCPTHSRIRFTRVNSEHKQSGNHKIKAVYPSMTLYQEIIFLDNYFDGLWVVENVIPYYEPFIPGQKIGRHLYWSNFTIRTKIELTKDNIANGTRKEWEQTLGFDLSKYRIKKRKDTILRNCVNPQTGKWILSCALNEPIEQLDQLELFNQKEDKQNAL